MSDGYLVWLWSCIKDSLPTEQWKNEIWKDGIANIDEQANGLGTFGSTLSYPYVNSVENRQAIQRWFVEETRLGIPVDFTNEGIVDFVMIGQPCFRHSADKVLRGIKN